MFDIGGWEATRERMSCVSVGGRQERTSLVVFVPRWKGCGLGAD